MKKLQSFLKVVLVVSVLVLCVLGLKAQDNNEKEKAIQKCGNANNVVERHTSQGEIYYSCKVEKK